MAERVKRSYDSTARREQAKQTRATVLAAARRMFLERGYAETTMSAVADEAGVSVETVYKAFANKPGLLKTVIDVAIVGDDEPVPMLERKRVQRFREEPDPRRKLAMYGDHLASSTPRRAPFELLARAAAATDPDAATLLEQLHHERLVGMTSFAKALHDSGHLRRGVSVARAADILWTYISAEIYEMLVLQRGWTPKRYARWVTDALIAALLPHRSQ